MNLSALGAMASQNRGLRIFPSWKTFYGSRLGVTSRAWVNLAGTAYQTDTQLRLVSYDEADYTYLACMEQIDFSKYSSIELNISRTVSGGLARRVGYFTTAPNLGSTTIPTFHQIGTYEASGIGDLTFTVDCSVVSATGYLVIRAEETETYGVNDTITRWRLKR